MVKLAGKTVLVTGGAGFIGSHLVKKLLSERFKVIVVDIIIHPHSIFYLEKLHKKVRFINADIRDRKKIDALLKKISPEYIFHLAAEPIVENAYKNPYETFETNIMGTANILEACRDLKNIKGIIIASSDKAYGKTKKTYTETSPLQGDHPYDVSKSCEDLISQTYFKTYELPIVITRFGNVYGEGDFHKGRIVPDICEAVSKRKPLFVRSDGTYVRDYLYVADVVSGYIFLMKNITKIKGEAFNFSSGDTYSVLNLIQKAEKILGIKIPYAIKNSAKNEIPYQHLNDTKVRKHGWKTENTFETCFMSVFQWYRGVL